MIISSLKHAIDKSYNYRHPGNRITTPYQLYVRMNRIGLHVSRQVLTNLYYDNVGLRESSKSNKNHVPVNIKLSVLDDLVRFLDVPISDILHFVSRPTEIRFINDSYQPLKNVNQSSKTFSKDVQNSVCIKITDYHDRLNRISNVAVHSDGSVTANQSNYYLWFKPTPIYTWASTKPFGFSLRLVCIRFNGLPDKFHSKLRYRAYGLNTVHSILIHLNWTERKYLDYRIISDQYRISNPIYVFDGFDNQYKFNSSKFVELTPNYSAKPIKTIPNKSTDYVFEFIN